MPGPLLPPADRPPRRTPGTFGDPSPMSQSGTPLESLLGDLASPNYRVRWKAVQVLGVRKDQRAVARLLQAVAEGGPYQFFYIQMLGEIGDPRAFEPLQTLLTAPEFMLRREVVTALRKIDNPRAVDLFYEQLEGLP